MHCSKKGSRLYFLSSEVAEGFLIELAVLKLEMVRDGETVSLKLEHKINTSS